MSFIKTIKFITNHPLNQDQAFNAIVRYAKWQVASRLISGKIVYDWVNSSKFLVGKGETGLTGNIYTGLHEFSDMAYLLHVLRLDDLFVDVGANVGSYTILACSAVGATGIAIEPVPETYSRLIANMNLNDLNEKVTCVNKGVGDKQGKIIFTGDSDTTNHVLAEGEQCNIAIDVEVTPLDMTLNNKYPSIIKIDVEGYEIPVLEGAEKVLKEQTLHSVIIETNGSGRRYGFKDSRIIDLMSEYGFKAYSYNPFERKLISLDGKNTYADSTNTIFVRNESFVRKRLKTSVKYCVLGKRI